MYCVPKPAEQTLPQAENLFKALLLPALLFASFYLATLIAASSRANAGGMSLWGGFGVLLLAVFNSAIIIGLGILAHEAVHRVLFRNRFCNEWIGGFLSALALIPFYANRQFHLTHHSYAHQPGRDPENPMHQRPFWQALSWGSVVALSLQYRILLSNLRHRLGDRRYTGRVLKDLVLIGMALGCYLVLLPLAGVDWRFTLLPTLLVLPLVFGFRALSDHYGLPAVARKGERADAVLEAEGATWEQSQRSVQDQVSGWIILTNPVIEWLWSHVNYHEVHHKFPWLSHAYLKPVFEATREQLPYRVCHGYTRNLLQLARQPYYAHSEVSRDKLVDADPVQY